MRTSSNTTKIHLSKQSFEYLYAENTTTVCSKNYFTCRLRYNAINIKLINYFNNIFSFKAIKLNRYSKSKQFCPIFYNSFKLIKKFAFETFKSLSLRYFLFLLILAQLFQPSALAVANKDAARLFEDLLADYNKLVRPVENNTATLVVKFKLKLSQLLDVVKIYK